ncbi:hypothetical protein DFH07DRAFT_890801 [Mycena maculata]|uniref:Uncharacterized protein n=1 Tax=Mycena maculata TaxID=230809 RepID=A0AAD7IJP4_9AGAR|nr:hypothetical protein DFH07DRAFT_890801 [Mycena maculata]
MNYFAWDGWSCRPLIDGKNRVFAVLAGRPRRDEHGHDSYAAVIAAATALFAHYSALATGFFGRRGSFLAVSHGVSFGGGQKRPGNLLNSKINNSICAAMCQHWAILRIVGFTNGMFQSFSPNLHQFYKTQMRFLFIGAPWLRRIFAETVSVFMACTFNFGPSTVTLPHVDAANLARGWCAITALGCFNPDIGGQLVLWHVDLNLIIRFPPGSTIIIPSALLRHSNISVQQGETRYSFTQFTAGGLFRWVYNGSCTDKAFYLSATAVQIEQREADRAQRWESGLKMFQVWNPKTRTFESQTVS